MNESILRQRVEASLSCSPLDAAVIHQEKLAKKLELTFAYWPIGRDNDIGRAMLEITNLVQTHIPRSGLADQFFEIDACSNGYDQLEPIQRLIRGVGLWFPVTVVSAQG